MFLLTMCVRPQTQRSGEFPVLCNGCNELVDLLSVYSSLPTFSINGLLCKGVHRTPDGGSISHHKPPPVHCIREF